jgi:hypothetical protein
MGHTGRSPARVQPSTDKLKMTIPFKHYLLKEITTKCSFAYTDDDFKETVDAFLAGQSYMDVLNRG